MSAPKMTHLEETVEGLGLALVWLVGKLGINEDEIRAGVAKLRSEDAERENQLVRDLAGELGAVLDPIVEHATKSRPRVRHIAYIELDHASYQRGGSARWGACACGWTGPERATLEVAVDDARCHEIEQNAT